jgi:hypothetical protein
MRFPMTLVGNIYLTHGLMLLCALTAAFAAVPESTGRIIRWSRMTAPAVLAAVAAIALVAYPTWGELRNPALWMFAILATVAGVARGYWLRLDVDHTWRLIRLRRAHDGLLATGLLAVMAAIEVALAATGPGDLPTMELGMTLTASYLIGRSGALLVRSRNEPQCDLHDHPSRTVGR